MSLSIEGIDFTKSTIHHHTPSPSAQASFLYPICIGHFFCDSSYTVRRYRYDSFLLLYVKSGNGYFEIDSQTKELQSGDLLLVDCYKEHCYYTKNHWDILWFHFDGASARHYYNYITSSVGNVISSEGTQWFETYFNSIKDIIEKRNIDKAPMSFIQQEMILFQKLLNTLTRLCDFALSISQYYSLRNVEDQQIEHLITYIKNNLNDTLTIQELAKLVSLSPYHFIRRFKKITGYTPHEYILHSRINVSKFILITTSQSIEQICYQCGFKNLHSFCVSFKKITGLTPTQYRNYNE